VVPAGEPGVGPVAAGPGPAEHAELADSLSMAFLVLLEALSPVERAVFMLREVFGYSYPEVARATGKTEVNCRQIFTRARRRIDEGRPRFEADRARQEELAGQFVAAFRDGDVQQLVELLAPDAVFYGDGGGKGRGLRKPVFGRERIGRLLAAFIKEGMRLGASTRPTWVNGQPGVMNFDGQGALINVMAFEIAEGQVQTVRSIINPDKLAHLGYRLSPAARGRVTDRDPSSS
jgi:RNA polymerase sigma-70 factor (ECF subfamily)